MAITKNAARQYPLVATVPFTEADFTVAAQAEPAIDIPAGATIVGGAIVVSTLFDGGAAQTLTVSGANVSTAAIDVDATGGSTGRTALTITGTAITVGDTVDIALGGVANGTGAGVGYLEVQYIMAGRSNENQDN